MKKILKFILIAIIYVISFGCDNITPDEKLENASQTSEISLEEFRIKTGLEKTGVLDPNLSQSDISYRTSNGKKYEIDTMSIKEHKYGNNKTSFSFRIYPKDKILKLDEAYNLIYVKSNNKWTTSIIHFKYKSSNNQTASPTVAYRNGDSVFQYISISYSHHCTNTGACANGTCDGCSLCVTQVVTYTSFSGGGGGGYSLAPGSYIPTGTANTGPTGGGGSPDPTDPYFFAPNINNNAIFGSKEYINQNNAIVFYNDLHYVHRRWAHQNNLEYQNILQFLMQNSWSFDSKGFATDLISTSIELDMDAAEVWNKIPEYRSRMSNSEKIIFDNMLPNRRLWYLCSGKKASDKAAEQFPDSLYNGKGDAYRHALWNGYSSLLIGVELTEQLTSAHENRTPPINYMFYQKETNMDLHNNQRGRNQAAVSNLLTIAVDILQDLNSGNLRYLNNLNQNADPAFTNRATIISELIPTNL